MRRNRILFYIAWILSVVGISFYGGPVPYSFFFLLTAVPILCFGYIFYVFFTYRIYQEIGAKSNVSEERVPFFLTIQNEYPILFTSLRVKFYGFFSRIDGLSEDAEYELSPGSGIRLETGLVCKYRGEYKVGVKTVTITDFLGLFSLTFKNREPLWVNVKPRMEEDFLPGELAPAASSPESERNNVLPDVLVREYTPGDTPRRINWKASARTEKLLVRNQIGEERPGILLIPDTERISEDPYIYIPAEHEIVRNLLRLSLFYVRQNIPVTLLALQEGGEVLKAVLGAEKDYEEYYALVSELVFAEDLTFSRLWDEHRRELLDAGIGSIMLLSGEDEKAEHLKTLLEHAGMDVNRFAERETRAQESDR